MLPLPACHRPSNLREGARRGILLADFRGHDLCKAPPMALGDLPDGLQ